MILKPALALLLSVSMLPLAAPSTAAAQSSQRVAAGRAGARAVSLPIGQSMVVDLPVDARDTLISNPRVADVAMRTPRRLSVLGLAAGQSDVVFFDESGRSILTLDVRVSYDTGEVERTIARLVPDVRVQVEALNESIVLTGEADNLNDAERAIRVAERFVDKPEKVLNMIAIAGQQQVMLKVRIVEVQRSIAKQLGVGIDALLNAAPGSDNIIDFVNPGIEAPGSLKLQNRSGDDDISTTLNAYERVGLVRILAEPNLTTISGQGAQFLAGGEFPVPGGVDQNGNVIITFRPYGVRLDFTPLVLSKGQIYLKVETEVSDLSNQGSISVNGSQILGVSTRRASTTVELPSGGALMIAGLLQSRSRQALDALPGLTEVPVLGALFRSRDFLNDETELVVIVTPYIVQPTSPGQLQTPADGLRYTHDIDAVLLGRLNRSGGPKPATPYQGPFGYVID